MTRHPLVIAFLVFASIFYARPADARPAERLAEAQEKQVSATAQPPQLSGTIVDTSRAVIAELAYWFGARAALCE